MAGQYAAPEVEPARLHGVDPIDIATGSALHDPAAFAVDGWTVLVADPLAIVRDLRALSRFADAVGWRDPPEHPAPMPFTGGAVGFLTDDLSAGMLDLPTATGRGRPAPADLPPLRFGIYDSAVCFEPGGDAWIVSARLPGFPDRSTANVRRWRERLRGARTLRPHPVPRGVPSVRSSLDRAGHSSAVARIMEWIAAGDLYQLNLTMQVAVPWQEPAGRLGRLLWEASPGAAHAAWLVADGVEVASVSPETFLDVRAGVARVRPIKGTRPRVLGHVADQRAAEELRRSPKDAAEHVMIVDLERSDLGRVAMTGTVRVPELAVLEAHPSVWHLTSTVEGRLSPGVGLDGLLKAMFPCGSVTGAPKRIAWERTALVEPVRRGVYCGAIGFVGRGRVHLSVAIRTAVASRGRASYGAGGGIVADSTAEGEWREAWDKARPFLVAVGATAAAVSRAG